MMPNQPPFELTPENINQRLNQMRNQLSGIEGEITTQRTDAQTSLFREFAGMLNSFYKQKMTLEHKLKEHEATLEQIYQGHPDIQIQIEKQAADKKAEMEKRAKIVNAQKTS